MASSTEQTMLNNPCGSGLDKCIQPWEQVNTALVCNRCGKALHTLCAAIDAAKAPTGQFENPDLIRICYNCLRPGESPNNFGIFSADDGSPPPVKRPRIHETTNDTTVDTVGQEQSFPDETTMTSTTTQGLHMGTDDSPTKCTIAPNDTDSIMVMGDPAKESTATTTITTTTMEDLDWPTLLKPHSSIVDLVAQNRVCAPQVTKKTLWWRLYHCWNMIDFRNEVVQPLAYCNLCGKVIKMSKVDRSPTPLKRHLQIQHKDLFAVMNEQKIKEGPVIGPPGTGAKHYYHSKNKGRKEVNRTTQLKVITQWIIETDQPLEVVESSSFRQMTSTLVSNAREFNVFDKEAVLQYMSYLVFAMQYKMKELLANQYLVHVQESWTANNRCSYNVDRVHWIDENFQLRQLVIACDSDTTMSPQENMTALWESVGVDPDKQVPVTVSHTKDAHEHYATGEFLYHGIEFHLNQIADIAYTALGSETKAIIDKVRILTETILSSPSSVDFLLKAQTELSSFFSADQPPLPILANVLPDFWWSTNEMITRLLYLRKALEYMLLDSRFQDELTLPTKSEWDVLEKLQQTWEPLNIATQLLHKQKYVTISLVPMIVQVIGEDLDPDNHIGKVKTCMKKMKAAFNETFGNDFPSDPVHGIPKIVWIAHALDPRFKSLEVLKATTLDSAEDFIYEALLDKMVSIQLGEDGTDGLADGTGDETKKRVAKTATSSKMGNTKRGLQRLSERFSSTTRTKKASREGSSGVCGDDDNETQKVREECQAELTAYKETEGMKMWIEHEDDGTKDFEDPLPWWRQHQDSFPTLWKLARMYLAIPATCSAPERAFDPEAFAALAKRCQAQASSTRNTKLLKENASLVEAFDEQPDTAPTTTIASDPKKSDGDNDGTGGYSIASV